MEADHIDSSEQLLNFQSTCTALPLFQPTLLGFFCCAGRLDLSSPVLIFLLFFSSSVVMLLAKEHYKWINECHEEIGNCLLDIFFFWTVLVITSILKILKIQELRIFYFFLLFVRII